MRRHDLEKYLLRHDCCVKREGGNHTIYTNRANGKSAAVPRHIEIKTATMRRICQDLDIPAPLAR
jgi:mRNA interferase HicA